MTVERRYSDWTVYRRVLGEARPYWGHIGMVFLLGLLSTPIGLLVPLPLKIAVDSVIAKGPLPEVIAGVTPDWVQSSASSILIFAVLMLVFVELLSQGRALSMSLLKTYTKERLTLHMRAILFRHSQRLSLLHHDRRGTADAVYRIQSDAAAVPSVAVDGVIPFVTASVSFVSTVVVIALIEPRLAAIAIVITPALAALTWGYRRRLKARHREVKALESKSLSVVQEVLSSIRVVKAFGQEAREEQRFTTQASAGMRARLRVALVDGSFWVAISLVTAIGTGSVLFVGVRSVESGAITLGSLLLVMGYIAQLYAPLYTMSRQVAALQSGFASSERAFSLLDETRDVPEKPDARPLTRAVGAVEFVDVAFAYDKARPVIKRASFRVRPGDRVGIAGHTGSGKSTLLGLLTRFYDPTSGAILLDGVDLRDYRLSDLRNQFAIVLQEPVLFSTTIGENIAYGKPAATDEEIVAAAKAAGIHEFVMTLAEDYDTPVGERGMMLSGGERQRVSLARAFLKDAPILILDEPTSSVDTTTEAAIIDAMERLMVDRTTFTVAHRLSTLESCNLRVNVVNETIELVPQAMETN